MARQARSRPVQHQEHRHAGDHSPQDDGGPQMGLGLAIGRGPAGRRDPQRGTDATDPLQYHQECEEIVGAAVQHGELTGQQLVGALGNFRAVELSFASPCHCAPTPDQRPTYRRSTDSTQIYVAPGDDALALWFDLKRMFQWFGRQQYRSSVPMVLIGERSPLVGIDLGPKKTRFSRPSWAAAQCCAPHRVAGSSGFDEDTYRGRQPDRSRPARAHAGA